MRLADNSSNGDHRAKETVLQDDPLDGDEEIRLGKAKVEGHK